MKDLEFIYWKDFLPNAAPHISSWEFEVFLNSSEQLDHSVRPRLSLLPAADSSQRLSRVDQRQHCPLKVLLAQRLPALGELCRETANVGEPLGQDVVTDDLQLLDAPHGGQLLVWDQHGVFCAFYLHSSQQDLGNIKINTEELTENLPKKHPEYRSFLSLMSRKLWDDTAHEQQDSISSVVIFFLIRSYQRWRSDHRRATCTFSEHSNWFPVMNPKLTIPVLLKNWPQKASWHPPPNAGTRGWSTSMSHALSCMQTDTELEHTRTGNWIRGIALILKKLGTALTILACTWVGQRLS